MRRAQQDDYIGTPHIEKKRADVTTEEESANNSAAQNGTGSTDGEDTEDQGRIPMEETTDTQDDEKEVIFNEKDDTREITESEPSEILQDDQGYYRVVKGQRVNLKDPGQYILNNNYKQDKNLDTKQQIDRTINRMKQEGRWPNSPEIQYESNADAVRDVLSADDTGELEELLEKADEQTLLEVYNNMLKDLNKGN